MKERILLLGEQKRLKFIIVGDSNVGKSCLFWKYTEGEFLGFRQQSVTTIDFKMKNVTYKDQLIKLYIWDTAGQERFRSIVQTYFKGCHGILLMFDQTNQGSFDNLINKWYPVCLSKAQGAKMVLVGNKVDLPRGVNQDEVRKWADSHGIVYFSSSAKQGINIEQPFMQLISLNIDKMKQPVKSKSFDLNNKKLKSEQKKKCC